MNIYAALALCFVPLFVMFSAIRRFAHVGIIVMLYAALLGVPYVHVHLLGRVRPELLREELSEVLLTLLGAARRD